MARRAQRQQKQQKRQNTWTEALAKTLKDAADDKYEGIGALHTDRNWANITDVKFEDGLLRITISVDSVLRDEKSWTRVLTLKPVGWERT